MEITNETTVLTISKYSSNFDYMRAICKCLSNEATRYALNFVYVDDDGICGTNGRIMAFMPNCYDRDELTNGFYKVTANNKSRICLEKQSEEPGHFPKYMDILDFDKAEAKTGQILGSLPVDLFKLAKCDICINPDYLAIFNDLDLSWYVIAPDRPLHLLNDVNKFHAVIMPINAG